MIQHQHKQSGLLTLYAVMHLGANSVDQTSGALVARNSGTWAACGIVLSDAVTPYFYVGNWHVSTPDGSYEVSVYIRQGVTRSIDDIPFRVGEGRVTIADGVETGGESGGLAGPSPVNLFWEDALGNPVPSVDFTVVGQGTSRAAADGTKLIGLLDGEYEVVSRPTSGIIFPTTTFIVNGPAVTEVTITGSATVITLPPDPSQTMAFTITRDGRGTALGSQTLTFRLVQPAGDFGSFERKEFDVVSDTNGLLQVPLLKSSSYEFKHKLRGKWLLVPDTGTGDSFPLPELVGFAGT
jgi:hypothetical protein